MPRLKGGRGGGNNLFSPNKYLGAGVRYRKVFSFVRLKLVHTYSLKKCGSRLDRRGGGGGGGKGDGVSGGRG